MSGVLCLSTGKTCTSISKLYNNYMSDYTTIIISKKTLKRLDKYQKSKKLRTRDDAVVDLLEQVDKNNKVYGNRIGNQEDELNLVRDEVEMSK